jgi:hypothetical protein
MWHLFAVVLYMVLVLVFVVLAVVVRELFLSSLALGVFFAAKAGFAVHIYEARRASAVDSASVARGFSWLGAARWTADCDVDSASCDGPGCEPLAVA